MFNPTYKLPPSEKNFYLRRTFRYGVLKYTTVLVLAGGALFTDTDYLRNEFNSRPDTNQRRVMTPVPDVERKAL